MRSRKLKTAADIAAWRLCTGCGACMYACPYEAISLVDIVDDGIRPRVDESKCQQCGNCVKICPGIELEHEPFHESAIDELKQSWGPVLDIMEGYACDPEIRFRGSSGGIATALALYLLEREAIAGVLHVAADKDEHLKNRTVFSRNSDDLLKACGSRYSPASPCEKLKWIEEAEGKCIFIGKPCDVSALGKARKLNPGLDEKVALTISIFCAGTPATKGTLAVLDRMGVGNVNELESFRYRGNGWPGKTAIKIKGIFDQIEMNYEDSWGGILSKHVPLRCRLCPDGTGEFADISCGDPWYRESTSDDLGRSLVLVRTSRGQEILRKAMNSGYVYLDRVAPEVLPASQQALLSKRRMLLGRLLGMRMMFVPLPQFKGFLLLSNWRKLSFSDKFRSVLGTLRRIITRFWMLPIWPIRDETVNMQKSLEVENE